MDVFDFNISNDASVSMIAESPYSKEMRIILTKGKEMKKHKAPHPIIIHILHGEIDFGIDGERAVLKAGNLVCLEGGVAHDLVAKEDSIIRLSINKQDKITRIEKVPII